ncbi:MAG: hypothetical protein RJQ00_07175 [Vicingaceae bacterium]
MKVFKLLFFCVMSTALMANDSIRISHLNQELKQKEIQLEIVHKKIDSLLNIPNELQHSGNISIKSEDNKSWLEFFFPSIIAIVLGLIALSGTIYASRIQRKSSEKMLQEQLKDNKKIVKEQLKENKELVRDQIKSGEKIANLNFKQNVLSVNRQNWINTLRDIISELISMVDKVALKKEMNHEQLEIINKHLLKAELMVNPETDKDYVNALKELQVSLFKLIGEGLEFGSIEKYKNNVINLTKKILKTEWERVKKGE